MLKHPLTVLAVLLLAGCAATSDIREMADGSYAVSARASRLRGGAVGASDAAYAEAQSYCTAKGLKALVVSNQENQRLGAGNTSLTFRCQ